MQTETDIVPALRAAGSVFAEDEAALLAAAAETPAQLKRLVGRRCEGVPLQHVLGWAEFCGLRVAVAPGVFVPRPRTEFLAHRAAERARPGAVVLDLCCGSGAVGMAVADAVAGIELHAADIDPAAVRCARRNLSGPVYQGDLYEPLPETLRGRAHVLVANVPYVPSAEMALMPRDAREHEPRAALDGGADGLAIARRVIADAPSWLEPGGVLLFETSAAQAPAALEAAGAAGLRASRADSDELEATVIVAEAP